MFQINGFKSNSFLRFIWSLVYGASHRFDKKFICPVCHYHGPFEVLHSTSVVRINAMCPRCGSLERHRLQYLVMKQLANSINFANMACLHIAPEVYLKNRFAQTFRIYHTADLIAKDVDFHFDLCSIPFEDDCYDVVYASHVLEHIFDDRKALNEISRILKPGGLAILPIPILSSNTIEYPEPNPVEEMHVRSPGIDYFLLYEKHFSSVSVFASDLFDDSYQTWIYEDRSVYPTPASPLRQPVEGMRHKDFVPVCYV